MMIQVARRKGRDGSYYNIRRLLSGSRYAAVRQHSMRPSIGCVFWKYSSRRALHSEFVRKTCLALWGDGGWHFGETNLELWGDGGWHFGETRVALWGDESERFFGLNTEKVVSLGRSRFCRLYINSI